jgi:hypothetical protein
MSVVFTDYRAPPSSPIHFRFRLGGADRYSQTQEYVISHDNIISGGLWIAVLFCAHGNNQSEVIGGAGVSPCRTQN